MKQSIKVGRVIDMFGRQKPEGLCNVLDRPLVKKIKEKKNLGGYAAAAVFVVVAGNIGFTSYLVPKLLVPLLFISKS